MILLVSPLKISYVIITVMFAISLTFTIVGFVTFDLSVQEIKKLLGSRNEGFASNMMQGLDKHIEKRILDFQDLTNLNLIHFALIESNKEFEKIENLEEYLTLREKEVEYNENTPFIGSQAEEIVSVELNDIIDFYHDEYNYDVIEELFVTNAYGANVALGSGTSDYSQSDEFWWQETKEKGMYKGEIQYNENYQSYSIDFAFRINDVDGNFIGVLRVLVTLDDLLSDFVEESNLLTTSGRNAILLDKNGQSFFSNDSIKLSIFPASYFQLIQEGKETGYFELEDESDDFRIISYAQSVGYRTFEGFDWVTIVEQNSSSIVGEFVDLRNSILTASVSGMIASVLGGLLISSTISSPLKGLSKVAKSISNGKFNVKVRKSKIDEIQIIGNSLKEMATGLEKLLETEKQLAEANVKIKNERLTAIGELSASLAHNMKNPLATIKTSAEILQKETKQNIELNEVVQRMNRAIDRMAYQIDDVLNYVRVTPVELKSIKIKDLLNVAKGSLNIPQNISLIIPESEIKIKCDVRKMEIVFSNIFVNAIQAIGNDKGIIKCKIKQNDTNAIIEIMDSGPGIPEIVLSKIFTPLTTTKQKGTGLGLSTCKNIIEQHHGTISAANNPTRFTIYLPLESY